MYDTRSENALDPVKGKHHTEWKVSPIASRKRDLALTCLARSQPKAVECHKAFEALGITLNGTTYLTRHRRNCIAISSPTMYRSTIDIIVENKLVRFLVEHRRLGMAHV
jgi:hypothetical protein